MSYLFISSTIIIIDNDCGVFVVIGIFCEATNRVVDYDQQDMDYIREKITISIMRKQIDLEVTMDRDKYQYQLADGMNSDDESINSVVALMITRDSQLCSSGKYKLPSFFFRTYLMDNLVHLGFENDFELSYSTKTNNTRDWFNDLFGHDKAFVPIHIVNSRFILAVIFIQDRRIVFYDMLQSNDAANRYEAILLCYLKKEYYRKHGEILPNDWLVHVRRTELSPSYTNDGT